MDLIQKLRPIRTDALCHVNCQLACCLCTTFALSHIIVWQVTMYWWLLAQKLLHHIFIMWYLSQGTHNMLSRIFHIHINTVWKCGIFVTTRQLISVISTVSNRGYKLPVPTAVEQSVDWLHLDSFPPMENSLPLITNPFHTTAYMHDSSEFVVNLFHNRSIVEDSVITVKIIKSEQWIFNGRPIDQESSSRFLDRPLVTVNFRFSRECKQNSYVRRIWPICAFG